MSGHDADDDSENKDEVQATLFVQWSDDDKLQKKRSTLQKVLQTLLTKSKFKGNCNVSNVSEDGRAEIRIKPAAAVIELQQMSGQPLKGKDGKTVTVMSISLKSPERQTPDNVSEKIPSSPVSEPQNVDRQLGGQRSDITSFTCDIPLGFNTEPKDILAMSERKETDNISEQHLVESMEKEQHQYAKGGSLNPAQNIYTNPHPANVQSPQTYQKQSLNMPTNEDEVRAIFFVQWSDGDKPHKKRSALQKDLQTLANKGNFKGDCTVLNVSEDGRAEIKIKPAAAVSDFKELLRKPVKTKDGKTVTITDISTTLPELDIQTSDKAPMNHPPSSVTEPQHAKGRLWKQSNTTTSTHNVPIHQGKFDEEAHKKTPGGHTSVCTDVFGVIEGTQPDGTMSLYKSTSSLPGFNDCGTIVINYYIPSGKQTERHPNPGQHYHGTSRTAYLPDNKEGKEVLRLLEKAFDQKLIFTVGTSTTTGLENQVTWNDIPHKTSTIGGPQSFGFLTLTTWEESEMC